MAAELLVSGTAAPTRPIGIGHAAHADQVAPLLLRHSRAGVEQVGHWVPLLFYAGP
jgi:hypothetical protein